MVEKLITPRLIEFRDEKGSNIGCTESDRKGIEQYKDKNVLCWFPTNQRLDDVDIVIYIDNESERGEEE